MSRLNALFQQSHPIIACIHLPALPGAPGYGGSMAAVYKQALAEAALFKSAVVDGLIVENFNDAPFYPEQIPTETVAAMAALTREIVTATGFAHWGQCPAQ